MVSARPCARYSAVSTARAKGLLIMALSGSPVKASARRCACARPVAVSSIPGNCPGRRCSTFQVDSPCRISSSRCFIAVGVLFPLEKGTLIQQARHEWLRAGGLFASARCCHYSPAIRAVYHTLFRRFSLSEAFLFFFASCFNFGCFNFAIISSRERYLFFFFMVVARPFIVCSRIHQLSSSL